MIELTNVELYISVCYTIAFMYVLVANDPIVIKVITILIAPMSVPMIIGAIMGSVKGNG